MIKFSSIDNAATSTTEATTDLKTLAHLIIQCNWSPGVFRNGHRNLENFERMDVIALDFDAGITVKDAIKRLKQQNFSYILGTSRNHQKEKVKKSGKVLPACDRFRVVFPLSGPISSDADYKATFQKLREVFPEADSQCSDASRFFYPCKDIVKIRKRGNKVAPQKFVALEPKAKSISNMVDGYLGSPSKATLKFIALGAPDGEWNGALFKAAKDLMEQGYDEDGAIELLEKPTGMLDNQDLKTIKSAFNKEAKYEKRKERKRETESELQTESITSLDIFDDAIAHLTGQCPRIDHGERSLSERRWRPLPQCSYGHRLDGGSRREGLSNGRQDVRRHPCDIQLAPFGLG